MGPSLAPALANIFMGFQKSKWLNEHNLSKPKFYLRYVDNILAALKKEQDSLNFLNFLNNEDPNIKFTTQKKVNHSIAFLDVFISGIDNQNLTLQRYHKSTYAGLFLNFKSFASFPFKICLIKCLMIFRYKFVTIRTLFIITLNNNDNNNNNNEKRNLVKNAYPPLLIDRVVKKYFDHKFFSNQN